MAEITNIKMYEPIAVVDTENLANKDWLEYRRAGIGGSDAAAILGVSPFATARDLYYDKKGKVPVNQYGEEGNWVAKEVGHRLEELVAEIFYKKTGIEVYPIHKMFWHPLYPFMQADVDFFADLPDGRKAILECKTTNYNCQDKWANGSVPANYEYQVRHYMAVMNLDVAYIACLYGNNENEFFIRKVERDILEEQDLIGQEQYFWEEYVQKGVEPPYTEQPDLVLKSLQEHIGAADKKLPEIILTDKEAKGLQKYLDLAGKKSRLEADRKRIDTEQKQLAIPIIEKLGKGCRAVLKADGCRYAITYNPTYRTAVRKDQITKLQTLYPEIYGEFVSTTESRILRMKKEAV